MASVPSKLYTDDVSLLVVLLDVNPFFWTAASSLPFSHYLSHVLAFLNSILLLSQMNQVVVIATGCSSCGYIYDSSSAASTEDEDGMPGLYSEFLRRLDEFVARNESSGEERGAASLGKAAASSLLSGSLSMALCYIQRIFRSGLLHPQPRILCLHGSPDGPEQYVAVMNSIFSAQRSMYRTGAEIDQNQRVASPIKCKCTPVPIDSCYVGAQNSAFLQQASHITGGVYAKPQHLDGLFQHLVTVFAADLHSRSFLQLPRPAGVDFRASCFCHKSTIDMGYVCSVCLSIFCKHHKKCSTCGSVFGQPQSDTFSASDRKRKAPEP